MSKSVCICCSGIVSPYHIANIYALIDDYYSEYKVELIISTINFWGKSIIPLRYIEYGKKRYGLKIENKDLHELIIDKDLKNSELVIVGVTYVNYLSYIKLLLRQKISLNHKTSFYSIDEGLGSHGFRFFRTLARQIKETNNKASFFIKFTFRYSLYQFLDRLLDITHIRLYDQSKNKLLVNENFKLSLKKVFFELGKENNKNCNLPVNTMLYLDQPLHAIGICSEEYESKILPETMQNFSKHKNMNLIVKNHPSKNNLNKDLILDTQHTDDIEYFDGCIEEFFSQVNCNELCVIGVSSNVLITANLLYGIKCYSLRGGGIDLKPLDLGHKIEYFFSSFTQEINLDDYIK